MKCPKCGYISFDYNEVCPKCNKGITPEREKMKLPSFKPAPPSLLGTLTGKAKKPDDADLVEAPDTAAMLDRELDFTTEDLDFKGEDILTSEPSLADTYSFEVPLEEETEERSQESLETFEFSESVEDIEEVDLSSIESDEGLSIDIEELTVEDSEFETSSEPSTENEIVLDSDLITIEDEYTEATSASELPSFDEETGSLALDDLIEAEPDIELEEQEAGVSIETDEIISLDSEEEPLSELEIALEEQEEEISFDLDKTISLDLGDLPKAEPEISLEEEPELESGKEESLLCLDVIKDEEKEGIL
jgi:hypothetical protein